ncbi:hypothetical protein DFP90_1011135 [Aestuariispira insulae]|uniref:Uncharacterized protein n=1 Tax=Aestuariispira insulae TaxID=1461337 RepID=A0A3D9HXV2_9PROT|nr:hypothetical protein DFP90_1011135 [Aestuariispira insulae]
MPTGELIVARDGLNRKKKESAKMRRVALLTSNHVAPGRCDAGFVKAGPEAFMRNPAFSLTFLQGAFQDSAVQIIGNGDIAGHDEKLEKKALLGKDIRHRSPA